MLDRGLFDQTMVLLLLLRRLQLRLLLLRRLLPRLLLLLRRLLLRLLLRGRLLLRPLLLRLLRILRRDLHGETRHENWTTTMALAVGVVDRGHVWLGRV